MPSYKMNSMSGLSVLKKPFSWKFGYPRFQKKVKVHFLEKESKGGEEEFPWEDVLEGLTGEPPTAVTDFSWDFTRHERVDTLPDLGVDLTHSSASSAANSNSAEDDSDDAASLRAAGGTSSRQDGKDLDWDQDEPDAAYSSLIRRGAQSLPVTICRGFEDADDGLGDEDNSEDPVYANCLLEDEPLYENFSQQLSGLGGLDALDYSDDEEHIYEHVHHHGHGGRDGHHPVNVFLALLQGSAPISPDPNIYEVPPGAIRCTGLHRDLDCLDSARNITPPSGFQDYEKLSWVRAAGSIRSAAAFYDDDPLDVPVHHYLRVDTLRDTVVTAAAQDEQDRHKLPVEVIYSTIVKPRRKKKQRPAISAMLQIAASMQPTPQASAEVVETVQAAGKDTEQSQADVNDNFIVVDSSEPVAKDSALVVQAEADCAQVSGSDVVSVEEVNSVIVNATEAPVGDVIVLTVKPSAEADNADHTVTRDCGSSERVIVTPPTPPVVSDDEDAAEEADTEAESEVVEVIEISSDGRWDTKELPPTEVDEALMQQQQLGQEDGCFQECPAEEAKIKHAAMAYGSQYYVHAPAAGAQQQQQRTVVLVNTEDASSAAPAAVSNIGTQIMKMYEDDRQKVRDSLNLPDVSLLDMDESMEDIERERRRVIVNQAVRAKRISSWIKSSDQQGGPQDPQDGQQDPQDPQDGEDAAQQHEDAGLHLNEDGEVVYDSILLNKQKTKSYWEQLMMAAAAPGSPPAAPPPTASSPPQQQQAQQAQQVAAVVPQSRGGGDLPSLEQAGSEVSEQEYFDARSSVSPGELLDDDALAGEGAGPKVVETVAKACRRLERESVVERDIRLQREREEQLAREREAALDLLRDDGFVSIPTSTTDEGACSEYGSEEKEHSIDGSSSRVMSPEVGALPHGLPHHHHQRTQSMDSTSSGHSSGSGSGSGSSAFNNAGRRRVTVKPLAEPEDQDTPAFIRPTNETPIEKEIRLAREREAELAREKALRLGINTPTAAEQTIINNNNNTTVKTVINNNNNINNVEVAENKESVRNATNRIQQEISRANEREQEHRHSKEGPQRFSTPEFPGRVKLKKAVSTSQLAVLASEQSPAARPPLRRLGSTTPQPQPQPQPQSAPTSRAPLGRSVSAMSPAGSPTLPSLSLVTPRRYAPHPSQKGVMQRFLASRGKVNPVGLVSNGVSSGSGSVSLPPVLPLSPLSPMSPSAPMSPVHVPLSPASTAKMSALVDTNREADREEPAPAPVRRGYTSAEDKIQEELKEMRRREEELRLQRARTFARSQPNLLSLLDDVDGPDSTTLKESSPVIDKLPAMAALRSALSNPNLLDEDSNHNGVDSFNEKKNLGPRKKNSLIAEWENRIQQLNEH